MKYKKVGYTLFWVPMETSTFKCHYDSDIESIRPDRYQREKAYIALSPHPNKDKRLIVSLSFLNSPWHKTLFSKNISKHVEEIEVIQLKIKSHNRYGFVCVQVSCRKDLYESFDNIWYAYSKEISESFAQLFSQNIPEFLKYGIIIEDIPIFKEKLDAKKLNPHADVLKFYTRQIRNNANSFSNYLKLSLTNNLKSRYRDFMNPFKIFEVSRMSNELNGRISFVDHLKVFNKNHQFEKAIKKYINEIPHQYERLRVLIDSQKSSISVWVGSAGFTFGVISIGLSLWFAHQNSKSTKEVINKEAQISQSIDNLEQKVINLDNHLCERIEDAIDSISDFETLHCNDFNRLYSNNIKTHNSLDSLMVMVKNGQPSQDSTMTAQVNPKNNLTKNGS